MGNNHRSRSSLQEQGDLFIGSISCRCFRVNLHFLQQQPSLLKPNENYYRLSQADSKGTGNWVGLESKQLEPDKPHRLWN